MNYGSHSIVFSKALEFSRMKPYVRVQFIPCTVCTTNYSVYLVYAAEKRTGIIPKCIGDVMACNVVVSEYTHIAQKSIADILSRTAILSE